jgi:hypothetical protein
MGGYLILIVFGAVFVAVVIHVLRTPRMPARRPFDGDESTRPEFTPRDPGAGRGFDGMV